MRVCSLFLWVYEAIAGLALCDVSSLVLGTVRDILLVDASF